MSVGRAKPVPDNLHALPAKRAARRCAVEPTRKSGSGGTESATSGSAGPPGSREQPAERATWRTVGLGRRFAKGGRKAPEPSRLRSAATKIPRERNGAPEGRTRSGPLEESRPQPASGRCGVSPLEWGGRDADSTAGKVLSPARPKSRDAHMIEGQVQRQDRVIHVKAERIAPLRHRELPAQASHDFR